jgi:hypothetical protein
MVLIGLITISPPRPLAAAQSSQAPADTNIEDQSYWFRILLPANLVPSEIGHASFHRGTADILVFAADLPVDVAALQQITGIQTADVHHLPHATILTIPLQRGQSIDAIPASNSFHVVLTTTRSDAAIDPSYDNGLITFPTRSAGAVVSVASAGLGVPLLIGTVMNRGGVTLPLVGPGYRIIPAVSGVVVAAASDVLTLRSGPTGFTLTSTNHDAALPVGNPPLVGGVIVSTNQKDGLDFPHGTIIALRHRIDLLQRRIAAAPPLSRREQSLRLARILLSLGLGPEAHGVLTEMLRSDPSTIDDPERLKLLEVSDVLADRPGSDPKPWPKSLADDDGAKLWRGLADAENGDIDKSALLIMPGLDRLIAAPNLLRSRVAPLAAETLIANGNLAPAQTLLNALANERNLRLAGAELLEAEHHPRAALRAFDLLLNSEDQRTAGIAQFRSTMLQVLLHQIDAANAAASLGQHVYEWRSPRHELDVRIAMAQMLAAAGAWPQAFAGLIRTQHLFPNQGGLIQKTRKTLFKTLIASPAFDRLPPLAAASILKGNADLIPPGDAGVPILRRLSHDLIALGLPGQAAVVLQQVIARSQNDESKARAGFDLASLDLDANHPGKAQTELDSTDAPDISQSMAASRTLLSSEIAAKLGSHAGLTSLAKVANPRALTVVTQVAASQHDWQALAQADQKLAALTVPPTGVLNQRATQTILQWAVAASHQNDRSTLGQLRKTYQSRLPPGRAADLFATITGSPLPVRTSLSAALAQISAIERVGAAVGPKPH